MTTHPDHKFSITIHTDDLAVVNCLRALSKYCQKTGNNNIPWGGTKDRDWKSQRHNVTFRFRIPPIETAFCQNLDACSPRVYGAKPIGMTTIRRHRSDKYFGTI